MNMVQSSHAEQYSSGEVVVLFPGRMVRVVLLMSVENVSPIAIRKNVYISRSLLKNVECASTARARESRDFLPRARYGIRSE